MKRSALFFSLTFALSLLDTTMNACSWCGQWGVTHKDTPAQIAQAPVLDEKAQNEFLESFFKSIQQEKELPKNEPKVSEEKSPAESSIDKDAPFDLAALQKDLMSFLQKLEDEPLEEGEEE